MEAVEVIIEMGAGSSAVNARFALEMMENYGELLWKIRERIDKKAKLTILRRQGKVSLDIVPEEKLDR